MLNPVIRTTPNTEVYDASRIMDGAETNSLFQDILEAERQERNRILEDPYTLKRGQT